MPHDVDNPRENILAFFKKKEEEREKITKSIQAIISELYEIRTSSFLLPSQRELLKQCILILSGLSYDIGAANNE